jgi:RNA polymerase sigma-70 factor (ECF subfamily)
MKAEQLKKSDKELLYEYQHCANKRALEVLIKRYSDKVHNLCSKYLKKNDTEDAVLEILGNLSEILKYHKICNFKSWLYVVTKNHCLMRKRQKERDGLQFYDPSKFEQISMENSEDEHHTYIDRITPADIKEALNQLKEPQKVCIEYFYYSKMSYQEISEKTGFDLKQVKSHIQNGKRNLKNYFIFNKKVPDDE